MHLFFSLDSVVVELLTILCYITLVWKYLLGTNSLPYWTKW